MIYFTDDINSAIAYKNGQMIQKLYDKDQDIQVKVHIKDYVDPKTTLVKLFYRKT
jgi:hypothetical protein